MGRNKKVKKVVALQVEEPDESSSAPNTPQESPRSPSESSVEEKQETVKTKKVYHGNRDFSGQGKKKAKNKKETTEVANTGSVEPVSAVEANVAQDASLQEDFEDNLELTKDEPVDVLYCPNCTFPAEMCEFSGMYEQCKPWLAIHAKELSEATERGRKRRALTEKERLERLVKGHGVKKAIDRAVIIEVSQRKGRKMITSVKGMDLFGYNLKDISREWKKLFSCGAGASSSEESKQDWIDIQGNVAAQLIDILPDRYNIPKPSIYQMEDKKKVQCYREST